MARFHCPKKDKDDPKKKCSYQTNFKAEMIEHATSVHGAIFSKQTIKEVKYKRRNKIQSTVI